MVGEAATGDRNCSDGDLGEKLDRGDWNSKSSPFNTGREAGFRPLFLMLHKDESGVPIDQNLQQEDGSNQTYSLP